MMQGTRVDATVQKPTQLPAELQPKPSAEERAALAQAGRLESWKEIANFFRRDVRTVQLWEQHESLPVHRHQHRKNVTVYAFPAELKRWWKRRSHVRPERSATVPELPAAASTLLAASQITVAVLPLECLSSLAADQAFVTGLTEQITVGLDKLTPRRLRVTSSVAVALRHAEGLKLNDVDGKLDADFLLHGIVSSSEAGFGVTLELLRLRDRSIILTSNLEYEASRVLDMQADVVEKLARALFQHVLLSRQVVRSNAVTPAARYAYLRGRYLWSLRTSPASMFSAMEQFKLATELDPTYAAAFSGLADCCAVLGWVGALPRETAMLQAREAVDRALTLDGSLAEGHVSLGCVLFDFEWDWVGAERELLRGIELDPAYAQAYCWYGQVLGALGRNAEALQAAQVAQDMDPASPVVNLFLGSALFHARQYESAIEQFQHLLSIQPDYQMGHAWLALAYEQSNQLDQAIHHFKVAEQVSGGDEHVRTMLAHAYALAGDYGQAKTLVQQLDLNERKATVPSIDVAAVFVALGENDTAMRCLATGYDRRDNRMTALRCDPRLYPLHTDPRFESLARQMRLC